MRIFNVGNSNRTVEDHVGTYHSLKIPWRRPDDPVIGTSGPSSCGDLVVGEPLRIALNGLNHYDGSVSGAAVVLINTTTAAYEMRRRPSIERNIFTLENQFLKLNEIL